MCARSSRFTAASSRLACPCRAGLDQNSSQSSSLDAPGPYVAEPAVAVAAASAGFAPRAGLVAAGWEAGLAAGPAGVVSRAAPAAPRGGGAHRKRLL